MTEPPITRMPDLSIDGAIFVCPDCHGPAELVIGMYEFPCDITKRSIRWEDVYAFSVKYWAIQAMNASKNV